MDYILVIQLFMSLLAEAHLIFNLYTYYIYLNHFYEFVSLAGKVNKTRKYILSFLFIAANTAIEDDWEILEEDEENSVIHSGFKKSLQREDLINKDNIDIQEEVRELMLQSSSSPTTFRGQYSTDLPHFVLSNN